MAPIIDAVGAYTTQLPVGYAGMEAETMGARDVASLVVETAPVAFGLAVGRGAADGSCRLGGTGYRGVTLADKSNADDLYPVGDVAGVMRKGTIWVQVPVAVTANDTPHFIPATGVITNVATGNTAIPNARFLTSAGAGGLVKLYLG